MAIPIVKRVRDRASNRLSKMRNRPSNALQKRTPKMAKRTFGEGTVAGAATAGVAVILEDTLGVPFGGSADITNIEDRGGYTLYTVNVDAPARNMAQARAFIESTTGFTSYLTDEYDIENARVETTRFARDTYVVEVAVESNV